MYNPNYSERAIPLVAVNEKTGKYQMTEEAIKFMRSVPAPLGVVSVAGLYRTGKSYLLNRMLLNTNKPKQGFGVGPTINPCTKGLWCWGTPIKGKSQNGQSINIIVIDTEGIGALDEDQTHDTRIFTLAILASSCFIYNSTGSIDQTAVQNLSLVVNLTKHIQLKSTNKTYDDEENADEIAHYFPTFYWVVRDFSLKIQDNQGNQMTQKQYLEKALAPVKTSSQFDQEAEEKNKIRKLLTSFFRDRDCFTMVRPLVDEAKLQDLDSIPFQDLRPEFIEQVINFRKRVTQGLKIKTLNGKQLNGDMYCNMMSSYVMAINEGAVPNIENAWNYMCQEQCQKIQDDCEALFDKQLRDHMKFPVEEDYFNSTCENALDMCMMNYRQKAIGQMAVSFKYELELKERIKQKIRFAREQNLKASKEFLQKKVNEVFNPIIEQLKKQQFKTFDEFEKTISAAYDNLTTNGPNLPLTKQKFLQLYKKVQKQGADYIFKCLNKQITNMKAMFKEKQQYYVKQLESIKNEQESDRRTYSMKISDLDKEKFETHSKIERLQIELNRLMKEKQSQTEKLSMNLTYKQSEFESLRKNLQSKMKETQERYEEMCKTLAKEQKVWEMEKAVTEGKIKQQANSIQQLQKQRHTLISKYQELNNEASMFQKDVSNKNQRKIAEMESQIRKLKENRTELNEQINSINTQLSQKTEKFERAERKLKEELNSKKREVQSLKNELEMQKKKLEQELQDERQRISKTKSTLNQDFKKQKDTISQLTEELRKSKADSQTRQAELEQKIKFLNEQKYSLKEQIEDSKRLYTRQIEDLKIQSNAQLEEVQIKRIEQTKIQYITQIKNVKTQHESQVKNYIHEIDTIRVNYRDLEMNYKLTKEKLEQTLRDYKQFQQEASEKIQSLQSTLKSTERTITSTHMEKQKLLKQKIVKLQQQIEQIKEKNQNDQRQAEDRHKECMIQLRITYEKQRQEIQFNHAREKDRAQRKFDQMVEDYESKHRQQIENLEEQMAFFKQQAQITEQELRSQNQDHRYTIDSKNKEIENLKNQLADLKALLNKKEDEYSRKFEQLTQTYKFDKQQMSIKIDDLTHSNSQFGKTCLSLNHQKNRLINDLEKARALIKETQDEYTAKKEEYTITINDFRKRFLEKQNQLMELKINYQKQTALLTQQNHHIRDKNAQLQSQLNRMNDVYEQKIRKIRNQTDQTIRTTTDKFDSQRNILLQKYDKTKKAYKQTQSALNKKLNEMEKQRAVDVEKINNLEMKLAQSEERKRFEVTSLSLQLDKLRELYKNEKTEMSNEIVKLRAESEELAKRKLEIETRFQKESLLSRNQLENQINKRKNQEAKYNEICLQYQTEIESLKQSKASDSSKYEATHQEVRMRLEQTYRTKISESSKIIEIKTRQFDELNRKYDNETKELKQKLAIQTQNRINLQNKLDRKMAEWSEHEKRVTDQINLLKSERQLRGLEFQKELEKQKLQLKIKVNDLENKVKSTEKQKMGYFMEVERQKAKFSQLQSSLGQEIQILKDKITKLEKDKVKMDKQNERLKAEKRTAKNVSYISSRSGLEERKSTITIKKIEKKQTSEQKYEDEENKENIISQQMFLD